MLLFYFVSKTKEGMLDQQPWFRGALSQNVKVAKELWKYFEYPKFASFKKLG